MTEICWFCNTNPGDPTKTIVLPIYLGLGSKIEGGILEGPVRLRTTYQKSQITVLRCKQCAEIHVVNGVKRDKANKAKFIILGLLTAAILGLLYLFARDNFSYTCIAGLIWLVSLTLLTFVTDRYISSLGKQESDVYTLPKVMGILGNNWKVGVHP